MKKLRLSIIIALTVAVFSIATHGWCDKVITKDGREYEGIIISEDEEKVVIQIGEREITIAEEDIEKITYRVESAAATEEEKQAAVEPELLEKFYGESLTITSGGRSVGYGTVTGSDVLVSTSSWTIWKGYHGFEQVAEADFFRIAGREDLAEMSVQYRAKARNWLIFGVAGFGGGIVLAAVSSGEMPLLITGVLLSNFGFWTGSIVLVSITGNFSETVSLIGGIIGMVIGILAALGPTIVIKYYKPK